MAAESIKVCCRFRMEYDHNENDYDDWKFNLESACISLIDKKFTYDYILPPSTTQEIMYDEVAKKTINDFTEGFHGTIFAYGQSGSGKTYSMLGPDSVFSSLTNENSSNELYGITPRAIYQIYDKLKEYSREGANWKLTVSYIEIYNEKLKCLLTNKEGLKIREDPNEGFIIPEKAIVDCKVPEAVFKNIALATNNRATGATKQNERSSRSHTILQLELIFNSIEGVVRKSRLSLVDLAGSERIAKTSAEGQRLKEAQKINQSLTTLGMVIMALTTPGSKHVPFRNSKLTLILKDSLGGSSKTTLLCTASRLKKHKEESIQTLYFASRAKSIKNLTKQNVILNAGELQYIANALKQELRILRGQVKRIGAKWNDVVDGKILSFITNEEFEEDKAEQPLIKLGSGIIQKALLPQPLSIIPEEKKLTEADLAIHAEEIKVLKSNMEIEKQTLQKIINDLNEQVSLKEKEKEEITSKFTMYMDQIAQIDKLFAEKKELEEKINELQIKNEGQTNQINTLNGQLIIFEIENDNLNTTVEDYQMTNLAAFASFQNIEKELKSDLLNKTILITELGQKAIDADEKVMTIENIYDTKEKSLTCELDSSKTELIKLNKMLQTKMTDAQVLIEKEVIYSQNIKSLKENNDEIMQENERLKKEILKIKLANNSEKVANKTTFDKTIHDLNSTIIEKNNLMKQTTDAAEGIKEKLDSKEKQIEILNKIIIDKDKEIANLKEKLNEKIGVYIEANEAMKKELEEKTEEVIQTEQTNHDLINEINTLTSTIQTMKIEALNTASSTSTPVAKRFSQIPLSHQSPSPLQIKKSKTLTSPGHNNVFGVTLKKSTGGTDFLKLAKKESVMIAKQTDELFKDHLDVLASLRTNIICDSPKTVSSRSDIIDDELLMLDFANDNTFLEAEEKLLAKEIEHQTKKELRASIKK